VIEHLAMAHAHAATRLRQQIRRIRHALHPARHDHIRRAGQQHVVSEHRGAHAGAAHLVDRGAAGGQRQARAERGLPRGRLTKSGRQHATHHRFFDLLGLKPCTFDRRADRDRAELRRRHAGEIALECGHRRTRSRYDHHGIIYKISHVSAP